MRCHTIPSYLIIHSPSFDIKPPRYLCHAIPITSYLSRHPGQTIKHHTSLIPPHPQALRRRHNLKHRPDSQTDRRPAQAAHYHDLFLRPISRRLYLGPSTTTSSSSQLGTLARLQYRKDNHGDERGQELRDRREDVVDAEVDARHAGVVGGGVEVLMMMKMRDFYSGGRRRRFGFVVVSKRKGIVGHEGGHFDGGGVFCASSVVGCRGGGGGGGGGGRW